MNASPISFFGNHISVCVPQNLHFLFTPIAFESTADGMVPRTSWGSFLRSLLREEPKLSKTGPLLTIY